jgi:hypothetical protein
MRLDILFLYLFFYRHNFWAQSSSRFTCQIRTNIDTHTHTPTHTPGKEDEREDCRAVQTAEPAKPTLENTSAVYCVCGLEKMNFVSFSSRRNFTI